MEHSYNNNNLSNKSPKIINNDVNNFLKVDLKTNINLILISIFA